jgi:hypothetical protein
VFAVARELPVDAVQLGLVVDAGPREAVRLADPK